MQGGLPACIQCMISEPKNERFQHFFLKGRQKLRHDKVAHAMFLRTPRTVSILLILLILLCTIVTVYSISSETTSALKESLQEKLMFAAGAVASNIDGDSFAQLHTGDENTTNFTLIQDQLRHVKEVNTDIHYIYTMRKNGTVIEFVVDGDHGISADAAKIGDTYPQAEPELIAGFSGPSVDTRFTTDQWGTVLSGFSPIRDSSGAVVGIVGVDIDSSKVVTYLDRINRILYFVAIVAMFFVAAGIIVVERRRSIDEQELLESEEKFKTLFESAGAAIFIMDRGNFLDCNHQTEMMYGYSRDQMLGQSLADFSPERQPDGRLSTEREKELVDRALSGEPQSFEWIHIRSDGTPFNVEVRLNRFMLRGKYYVQAIVQDITERKKAENALKNVSKKLNLLNTVTFNEIQNAIFVLNGYISLEKSPENQENVKKYREKEEKLISNILKLLVFAKNYQNLGVNPPQWQNVTQSFSLGISHVDFSQVSRAVHLDNLEIYADSLLERVFFALADNVLRHAKTATLVSVGYQLEENDLLLFFEDNAQGIPETDKEKIFERRFGTPKGMELFLVREILGITGITIKETGTCGRGARFEIHVPKGEFRFTDRK
jgi:PAS domain S-box-containing protein